MSMSIALRRNLLAAHFFFQRIKQLVHLHRKRARLGCRSRSREAFTRSF